MRRYFPHGCFKSLLGGLIICMCRAAQGDAHAAEASVWLERIPKVVVDDEKLDVAVRRVWEAFQQAHPTEKRLRGVVVLNPMGGPRVTVTLTDVPLGYALSMIAALSFHTVELHGDFAALSPIADGMNKPVVSFIDVSHLAEAKLIQSSLGLRELLSKFGIEVGKFKQVEYYPERQAIFLEGPLVEVKLAESLTEMLRRTGGKGWLRSP